MACTASVIAAAPSALLLGSSIFPKEETDFFTLEVSK